MNSGSDNTVYAVLVDFSSCIDENELLYWNCDGMTIKELQNRLDELQSEHGQSYTYVGGEGTEHTRYLPDLNSKAEIKEIKGKINEIKTAYYEMKIQSFENTFHQN